MAHFAEIDQNNIVLRVLVVGDDQEHRGQEFLADDLGLGGTWIQTSYNTGGNIHYGPDGQPDGGTPLHMNYAGVGSTWDGTGFATPSFYESWVLDENYVWQAPTPRPDDDVVRGGSKFYKWDEDTVSWVQVDDGMYEWDEDTTSWVEVTE
ncbi:hypothetical protein CMI48_04850 [Candidatus Pacearchaeota archaeon]|nr:hypothetical protein [Candidatus Pacearchaeota archaeon]